MRQPRFIFGTLLACTLVLSALPQRAQADHALLSPPQGTETLQSTIGQPALAAIADALRKHDITSSMDDGLGIALVECEAPACVETTLTQAHAELGFILAVWKRRNDPSIVLTLTLLDRNNHTINVRQTVVGGNISTTATSLVEELLRRREEQTTVVTPLPAVPTPKPTRRKNAWLAGPIILLAGGAGTLTAGIVGAAKGDSCQAVSASGNCEVGRSPNTAVTATLIAVGVAAVAGAAVWWNVGKRKRETGKEVSFGIGPGTVRARLDF